MPKLNISTAVMKSLEAASQAKGLPPEEMIAFMARTFTRPVTIYGTSDRFDFGKYRDEESIHVAQLDPGYIIWMREKACTVDVDDELLDVAQHFLSLHKEENRRRYAKAFDNDIDWEHPGIGEPY